MDAYAAKGLAYADYYADVFNRWAKMFGPPIFSPPNIYRSFVAKSVGFRMTGVMSTQSDDACRRISECIGSSPTKRAFEGRIFFNAKRSDGMSVFYINGNRHVIIGGAKIRRMEELLFLYSIVGSGLFISDVSDFCDEWALG